MNPIIRRQVYVPLLLLVMPAATPASECVISVCEALSQRDLLRDKLVAIRGLQVATDEGTWLEGTGCEPLITDGYRWHSSIWLEMSSTWRNAAGIDATELESSTRWNFNKCGWLAAGPVTVSNTVRPLVSMLLRGSFTEAQFNGSVPGLLALPLQGEAPAVKAIGPAVVKK